MYNAGTFSSVLLLACGLDLLLDILQNITLAMLTGEDLCECIARSVLTSSSGL